MKTSEALNQIDQEISRLTTLRSLLSRLDSIPDDTAVIHLFGSLSIGIHKTADPKGVCRTLGGKWTRERFPVNEIIYQGNLPGDTKVTIFGAEIASDPEPLFL
jgi:hypothetical protein